MQKNTSTTGFSLVEVLIAVSVFGIIMTLVGSLFVHGLDLQRRAANLQQVEENATFVLETMLKEIRVADITAPLSDSPCPGTPDSTLTVAHPDHGTITYRLSGTQVIREAGGVPSALNSSTVEFTRLGFCVSGASAGDTRQPRVTVIASMQSTRTKQQSALDIQTSISPRKLND